MPISIGIPFYNAEKYLEDAIRSVFAQTYEDWELILIDDGSTDDSLEIARSVNDPRVRVISDGQNRQLSYRLNQIIAEARYDLIGRMDADDLISPTRFEKQLAILNARPDIDLVTTGICSITNDNHPVGVRCGSPDNPITGQNLILGRCGVVHAAMLGRKSWFERNPYDELAVMTEDYELWLRSYANKDFKLHILSEPLYYYREENSTTQEKLLTAYRNQIKLINKYGYLGFSSCGVKLVIAKFLCKIIIVKCLDFLNKTNILIQKRNVIITDESLMCYLNNEINIILKTILPR